MNQEFTKIPPQDLESESALLGSMLVDPEVIDNILAGIKPEYFYKESHKIVFAAMQSVHESGATIDYISVSNGLRSLEKLETIGGVVYLTELTKGVSTGYNHGYFMMSIIDKFVRREYIRACNESINLNYSELTDISDNISLLSSDLMRVQEVFSGVQRAKKLKDLAQNSINEYYERKKLYQEGKITGVSTGLKKLNKFTGGWQNGDSILVAGRTSMGKTAMALSFSMAAYSEQKKVQFFSYEMTAERLADRIVISQSLISPDAFKYGNLLHEDENNMEASIDYLSRSGFFIDDNSNMNIDQLFAKCRIAQKRGECDMVVIDYIGLIPSAEKKQVREQEVSEISKKIKKYAKELQVPVITLVQINRGADASSTKRPKLSELRESGSLEQDADVVVMVYRPEYYMIPTIQVPDADGVKNIPSENMGIAIIAKQRNGRTGDILFQHSHGLNVIKDYTEENGPF